MVINIDKKAEEFIKSNSIDNTIQVIAKRIGGGWCQTFQPSVEMGKPSHEDSFNHYKVGDISVYVLKWLNARDDEIRIHLSKFLWTKSLYVDGISF